jgi:hypothetical protein
MISECASGRTGGDVWANAEFKTNSTASGNMKKAFKADFRIVTDLAGS